MKWLYGANRARFMPFYWLFKKSEMCLCIYYIYSNMHLYSMGESMCSIDICLAGRNDASRPLVFPWAPCSQALSLQPSCILHHCHLMRQHLYTNTAFIATSGTADLYLGEWSVNIISTVTHLTAFPGFKAHWSLAPFKYQVAFNVGGGEIIRLTKMNNWCVCGYTCRASFFIVIVDC